jgi:hypothetical protein
MAAAGAQFTYVQGVQEELAAAVARLDSSGARRPRCCPYRLLLQLLVAEDRIHRGSRKRGPSRTTRILQPGRTVRPYGPGRTGQYQAGPQLALAEAARQLCLWEGWRGWRVRGRLGVEHAERDQRSHGWSRVDIACAGSALM